MTSVQDLGDPWLHVHGEACVIWGFLGTPVQRGLAGRWAASPLLQEEDLCFLRTGWVGTTQI